MTFSYTELEPEFAQKVQLVLQNTLARGITMVPYYGLRTSQAQGKLWRQSRSTDEIESKIADLRAAGASFLADCIEQAGPQEGTWATDAIPGFSEHNYGVAVDCYWLSPQDGKSALWEGSGYLVYQDEAAKAGLYQAFLDKTKDIGHIQGPPTGSSFGSLEIVNSIMKEKFDV